MLTKLPNGSWEHVPSSRADVFATKHVSVVEKRILMKFINFSYHIENRVRMSLSYDNRFLEKVGKGSDDLAKKEIRKALLAW